MFETCTRNEAALFENFSTTIKFNTPRTVRDLSNFQGKIAAYFKTPKTLLKKAKQIIFYSWGGTVGNFLQCSFRNLTKYE